MTTASILSFSVPGVAENTEIKAPLGSTVVFVGANGSGKTRLASHIERILGDKAHRIAAHRALSLNPNVPKIRETDALNKLRWGVEGQGYDIGYRAGNRWQGKGETILLNDFDAVIQALFADQNNVTKIAYDNIMDNGNSEKKNTKLRKIKAIWDDLMRPRRLEITGDDIKVFCNVSSSYSAADMSDGERAVFYLIGQALCAPDESVIIFDEPELHIHRAIMSKLWDALAVERPDCVFLLITHDLEFAASRVGQKFAIRDFQHPAQWQIEEVPEETGFPEEIVTRILGSRRPILFVEGKNDSLDKMIYRSCYLEWTVIAKGSCEEVIHAVTTMRKNATLNRLWCAGIVDADARTEAESEHLRTLGIHTLPVSEVENLILLPGVSRAILAEEGHDATQVEQMLAELTQKIFGHASEQKNLDAVVARHCHRRIDQILKKVDLSGAADPSTMTAELQHRISSINIATIDNDKRICIAKSINDGDIEEFLKEYDNKEFLAYGARILTGKSLKDFRAWLSRILQSPAKSSILNAIKVYLPSIPSSAPAATTV